MIEAIANILIQLMIISIFYLIFIFTLVVVVYWCYTTVLLVFVEN